MDNELDLYFNFEWLHTGFDDPRDFAAVALGIDLFDIAPYPDNLNSFSSLLPVYSDKLDRKQDPGSFFYHEAWPYRTGYFNGG